METLARLILSLIELLEAEARTAKSSLFRLGISLVVLAAALCLFLAGGTLLLVAFTVFLIPHLGEVGAMAATGVLCLALCGGFLWIAKRINQRINH